MDTDRNGKSFSLLVVVLFLVMVLVTLVVDAALITGVVWVLGLIFSFEVNFLLVFVGMMLLQIISSIVLVAIGVSE